MLKKFSKYLLTGSCIASVLISASVCTASETDTKNLKIDREKYISKEQSPSDLSEISSISFNLLWTKLLSFSPEWLSINSNILTESSLFSTDINAYDTNTGNMLWSACMPSPSASAPICTEGSLYLAHKNNSVSVYQNSSGDLKFRLQPFPYEKYDRDARNKDSEEQITGHYTKEKAIAQAKLQSEKRRLNHLIIKDKFGTHRQTAFGKVQAYGSSRVNTAGNGLITIFKNDGSSVNWYMLPMDNLKGKGIESTPAVLQNDKGSYMYTVRIDGELYTTDLNNPSQTSKQTIGTKQEFRNDVKINGSNLYLTSADGTIFCFEIKAAKSKMPYVSSDAFVPQHLWNWSVTDKKSYQTNAEGRFVNDICFDSEGKRLFTAAHGKIYALSAKTGHTLWKYDDRDFKPALPPAVWHSYVLAVSENAELIFLNSKNGDAEKICSLPFVPSAMAYDSDQLAMSSGRQLCCWQLIEKK